MDRRYFANRGDSSLADRAGQSITVLSAITEADAEHDAEVLPMYRVRFPDGYETSLWPDEIEPEPRGACILTGAEGEDPEDCATHDHEAEWPLAE